MSALKKIKSKVNSIQSKIESKPFYHSLIESIKKMFYIFMASFEKFQKDTCNIRSSAIAYAIAISVIPILTILIRFASIDRIALRATIGSFLASNGMADTTELLSILDEILGRANQIAGIGILFMLYSATNLVRNLEESFNHIYRVRSNRPMLYRFALYTASFAIIPTLIIFSMGAARLGLSKLQPAEPTAMHSFAGSEWILHEPGLLWQYKNKKIKKINLYERTNTGASFRDIFIDEDNKKVGPSWEIAGKDFAAERLAPSDLYGSFILKSWKDNLYVFTKKGLFLYSDDKGSTWKYNRIYFKLTEIHSPEVRDVHITSSGEILFLVGINSRTGIVSTRPGGKWQYNRLIGIYNQFQDLKNIPEDSVNEFKNGLYLLGKGKYMYSNDEGKTFSNPHKEQYGNKNMGISSLVYNQDGEMLIVGNNSLWINKNGKQIRPDLRLKSQSTRIQGFIKLSENDRIFYGTGEIFRYSQDKGRTWLQVENSKLHHHTITAHLVLEDGSILLSDEHQSLLHLSNAKLTKTRDSQGFLKISFQIKTIKSIPTWFKMTGSFLVFVFIFASCFAMFLFTYKFVPNTIVTWKAASFGSLFTSVSILGFFVIFKTWIGGFTTTGYIYGVWAAIPLGMLVILSSTAIILFGLELAFVIQHPVLYLNKRKKQIMKRDSLLWSSIHLLSMIYHRLYGDNSALTDEQAVHYFEDNLSRLDYIRETLLEARLISYNDINGEYYPVKPASEVSIDKLQEFLIEHSLKIPARSLSINTNQSNDYKKILDLGIEKVHATMQKSKNNLSLADLLPVFAENKNNKKAD